MGGHSGMDIDKGRGNANKMIARLLVESPVQIMLHDMNGGGLRNAIPREAVATISVDPADVAKFEEHIKTMAETFKVEYAPVETKIELSTTKTETPSKMVANHDKDAILFALNAVFNGVFKMSLNFDNLVETSSSLAQVVIKEGTFETKSLQRSSVETTKDDVARTIKIGRAHV